MKNFKMTRWSELIMYLHGLKSRYEDGCESNTNLYATVMLKDRVKIVEEVLEFVEQHTDDDLLAFELHGKIAKLEEEKRQLLKSLNSAASELDYANGMDRFDV